jgi:hypothetical protein
VKKTKNPLIYFLAGIGVAALLYKGWTIYQRHVAEEEGRASFSASPAPGTPDFLGAKPQPPPQP